MAIGKLLLKLGIDTTNLDKELGKVEKSMSKFGNSMKNVGSNLTQSLTLPIIGLGAASLKAFANMERLQNGLTAIMGSSQAAEIELNKLRKTAENPGLALPQVVEASSSLQSVGMSADVARETITQFGNAVARAGGGAEQFSGVVLALSQISAVGKVTQQDLNQIKGRLPEFAKVMQQEFGVVTADAIRDLGISSEEFISRSVGALSELERANGGLGNAFDNLKDNVTASLAELGKAINESLKLEVVFDKVSKKIQELVDKFKLLSPEQQGNIVKFGLVAAAVGPIIFILGQLATSISSIITLSRTLIATFTILSGGTYLVVVAIGALIAYFATTDEGQKSLSKTGLLLSESFDRIKEAFANTLNLLSKLQPLFDVLLFVFGKIAVFTFEVVLGQINLFLKTINFLYDGVIKVLEGLRLINKEKVTQNTGFGGGSAGRPSGAGVSFEINKKPLAALPPGLPVNPNGIPNDIQAKGSPGIDAIRQLQINAAFMEFNQVSVNALPTLDLIPQKLESISVANKRLKQTNLDLANSFTAITHVVQSVEVALTPMQESLIMGIDAFANLAESGFKSMEELATAVKKSIAVIIGDMIKVFVAKALAGLPPTPFLLAIAPAVAALAGSLGKNLIMKIGAPKLAEGGLAFGPTMATVGDNRNARVDPEVIAPLSKLKSMMGDMGMGGVLETRISGNDLIILLNRSQKGLSRIQ